jgi:hypothetical protein
MDAPLRIIVGEDAFAISAPIHQKVEQGIYDDGTRRVACVLQLAGLGGEFACPSEGVGDWAAVFVGAGGGLGFALGLVGGSELLPEFLVADE